MPASEPHRLPRRQLIVKPASEDHRPPSHQHRLPGRQLNCQQANTIVPPTVDAIIATESEGWPTMPGHRCLPHHLCRTSKHGADKGAKALLSAPPRICVVPASNHHSPTHCQLVVAPASEGRPTQPRHRHPSCCQLIIAQASKPSSALPSTPPLRPQASTIVCPAANLLSRERASTTVGPITDSSSHQQARNGRQCQSTIVRPDPNAIVVPGSKHHCLPRRQFVVLSRTSQHRRPPRRRLVVAPVSEHHRPPRHQCNCCAKGERCPLPCR